MRVAIVHDSLTQYGGAERVVEALSELWSEAPIFTLFYDEKGTRGKFAGKKIIESFWARVPIVGNIVKRHNQLFFWLMPSAIGRFDLSGYDLVISSSATYAKGAHVGADAVHISYCHTPTRYLWGDVREYVAGFYKNPVVRFAARPMLAAVRWWDRRAAGKPHHVIANSRHIAGRIKAVYGRDAAVIYPPVDLELYRPNGAKKEDFYLMAGRFLPYKRFDLGIEAARLAGVTLKIVGDGRERRRLERIAPPNVEFLGWLPDEKLAETYAAAKGLLFPQTEDFGLVAAEAMACGTPVIAYRAGGSREIVREGENGISFDRQTPEALAEAIGRFEGMTFEPARIRASVERFSKERFKKEVTAFIEEHGRRH